MKRYFVLAALCLALTPMFSLGQQPSQDTKQKAEHFRGSLSRPIDLDYLLFLPKSYEDDPGKRWPLMMFLHGAGERGTNLMKVTVHGPPKIVQSKPEFPFVLISPQCPSDQTWDDEGLLMLLDHVTAKHRIDTNRVYLTGLSMGGYATWSLGTKHPDRFAAIAPICGGGDKIDVLLTSRRQNQFLKTLPVWAFHGAKDSVVELAESERMVAALKKAGNKTVRLTVYPEANHDSWTETYKNQELYDWFLSQVRGGGTPP